jgi:hypothetical protein
MSRRDDLSAWCQRTYERASKRLTQRKTLMQSVPDAVRVTNKLSGRAVFEHCLARRKGYFACLRTAEFAAIDWPEDRFKSNIWGDELDALLLDRWLRGAMWQPARITASPGEDGWVVSGTNGAPLASFLAEMGQPMFRAQVFQPEDVPATAENLDLLVDQGLYRRGALPGGARGNCLLDAERTQAFEAAAFGCARRGASQAAVGARH